MAAGVTAERLVRAAQAEDRLPSLVAAVVRDGRVVWSLAVGLADAEAGTEPTDDTQYRIGSVTKTFTAVAVMRLRDAGAVELDAPLSAYLPKPGPFGAASLRRLLSHLSGLQREPAGEVWESLETQDRAAFLASLADAETVLPSGRRWHYSNLAFALLGEVVASVAGRPYEDVLAEEVLAPLGMTRTTFSATPPHARGYLVDPYADRLVPEPDWPMGASAAAGQLWSTPADLARWAAFLAEPDPAVLSADSLDEMTHPQVISDPDRWTLGYGLGLQLFRRGERVLCGHGGAMPGFLAGVAVHRPAKTGAVVFTNNTSHGLPTDLACRLTTTWLDEEPVPTAAWAPGPDVPADVEGLLGRWWSEGGEWVFSWRRGRLEIRGVTAPPHLAPSVLERDGEDAWRIVSGRECGERVRVVRDESGTPVKLYLATYPYTRDCRPFGV